MTDSLLPPNATATETAVEALNADVRALTSPAGRLWNPATCPAPFLPWLAWAMSVDHWRSDWPTATKRAVIAASPRVHRLKGTAAAVRAAVSALWPAFDLVEWFRPGGSGVPHTARIDLRFLPGAPDALGVLRDVNTAAIAAAGARDHLQVALTAALTPAPIAAAAALAPPITGYVARGVAVRRADLGPEPTP